MSLWQQLLLQGALSLVSTGGLVMLLKVGPERRKLGADTTLQEASAAATLTGSALSMVKHAEDRAASAEVRAQRAEDKADHAEQEAEEAQRLANLAQQRLSQLVAWMRTQGIDPPPWVEQSH